MYLELLLHWLILFRSWGFVPACSKVLDAYGTEWIGGFVRYTTGSIFQGRVGTGISGIIGGD
jgi:hypothetical protein